MRANRLLSILIRLQLRGRLTARALAGEFEVSERTIYRDIDELSASGVPVSADRGPGGGFQLLGGYQTRLTGLTETEAESLLLAGLPGPAANLGLGDAVAMSRLKLLAAAGPAAGTAAARVGERFHLDPHDWYREAPVPVHLRAIATAVWAGHRIAIRYESWSGTVERTLNPLGLVLKAGTWYLVARAARSIRTYKVANVRRLRVRDETFTYPPDFNLAGYWQKALKRFEASLRRGTARLRVSPAALSTLDRLGTEAAGRILQAEPDAEGWREATIDIESIGHAAGLLLGFGDEIEVLTPPELRRALAERAARTAALYER